MATTGHYLKPGLRVTTPGVVFSVAVDTYTPTARKSNFYREHLFRSAVATFTRKRDGKWSLPKVIETDSCDELRDWIHSHAQHRKRNYIICPVASDVLTLSRFWLFAEEKGVIRHEATRGINSSDIPDRVGDMVCVRRCCLRGKPDIFDYLFCGKRYIWLSGSQYFNVDERQLGESIGFIPTKDIFTTPAGPDEPYSTLDKALLWSQAFCQLSNWWSENAKAPFGLTVGSLAMGVLRTYVKPKSLSTHTDEIASRLERLACYGGRQAVWYVGGIGDIAIPSTDRNTGAGHALASRIPGPIYHYDIRSMYPYLLSSRTFPCKLIKRTGTIKPADILGCATHCGVIASVLMWADAPEYPVRQNGRIIYPRGYIQTTLTGAELAELTAKDRIITVFDAALYSMGYPFKEAAQALLDIRVAARENRNAAWELFAKTLGASLGGKLAQRRSSWRSRPDVIPERQWGEWVSVNLETETKTKYRSICGLVEEAVTDESGYGPFTSAFAYLSAYGRVLMRNIREKLPQDSVISQDTDGFWSTLEPSDVARFCAYPCGNLPGELACKGKGFNARFLDAKHYVVDGRWTLAGFSKPPASTETLRITDSWYQNPVQSGARHTPISLLEHERDSALTAGIVMGTLRPDGWIDPPYFDSPPDVPRG